MTELPKEIRDRTPAPHALRVGLRRPDLPVAAELAAFCVEGEPPPTHGGSAWLRFALGGSQDTLLVLLVEGGGIPGSGFDHFLVVESGSAKACFLAAYFIARRCGGVIQVRQRAAGLAAAAFAERYLEDTDLEARWMRATGAG
jgi:hypothetical protein